MVKALSVKVLKLWELPKQQEDKAREAAVTAYKGCLAEVFGTHWQQKIQAEFEVKGRFTYPIVLVEMEEQIKDYCINQLKCSAGQVKRWLQICGKHCFGGVVSLKGTTLSWHQILIRRQQFKDDPEAAGKALAQDNKDKGLRQQQKSVNKRNAAKLSNMDACAAQVQFLEDLEALFAVQPDALFAGDGKVALFLRTTRKALRPHLLHSRKRVQIFEVGNGLHGDEKTKKTYRTTSNGKA
jgi:hypothetical protein